MGVPTFNSTEEALTFTIYDCILIIRPKKVCYLTKVSPLDVELIWHAPSVECAVLVYRLTASKGLIMFLRNLFYSFALAYILSYFCWECGKSLLTKYVKKNATSSTTSPPATNTVASGTRRHPLGIGIPGYTFGSTKTRARAIKPSSWSSAPQLTTGRE